jgi:hypothetical protein
VIHRTNGSRYVTTELLALQDAEGLGEEMRADDEGQPILANSAHDVGRRAAWCDDRGDENARVDDDSAHLRGR